MRRVYHVRHETSLHKGSLREVLVSQQTHPFMASHPRTAPRRPRERGEGESLCFSAWSGMQFSTTTLKRATRSWEEGSSPLPSHTTELCGGNEITNKEWQSLPNESAARRCPGPSLHLSPRESRYHPGGGGSSSGAAVRRKQEPTAAQSTSQSATCSLLPATQPTADCNLVTNFQGPRKLQ